MNAMGPVQSLRDVRVMLTLHETLDEPQKKSEIHFYIYIFLQPFYALFSSFLWNVCKLHGETKWY